MRIPVNSCPGCNQDIPISEEGGHWITSLIPCPFVEDALKESNCWLVAAYDSKNRAVRRGKQTNSAILWVSQGPHNIWLVVKEKSNG